MHDYQESKAQHDAKTDEIVEMIQEAETKGQVVKGKVWEAKHKEVLTRGATARNRCVTPLALPSPVLPLLGPLTSLTLGMLSFTNTNSRRCELGRSSI